MPRFSFERKDNTVKVTFNPTQKSVVVKTNDKTHGFSTDIGKFRYFEYSGLVQGIIHCVVDANYIEGLKTKIPAKAVSKKQKWLYGESYRQLGKAFHPEWKYLHTHANPDDLELDKAITRCVGPREYRTIKIFLDESFWENPFIRKDCINFRAAMLAALNLDDYNCCNYRNIDIKYSQWKESYAPDQVVYTTLNKTFPNINFAIPWYILNYGFKQNRLPHPYKLKEQVVSHYVAANRGYIGSNRTQNASILLDADKIEWTATKKAFKKWFGVDFRKSSSLMQLSQYLLDYPERYEGTLIGLLRRSEDWHRRAAYTDHKKSTKHSETTKTATLPAEMNIQGIKFLETVGDIIAEGADMQHCVGSYSDSAVKGRSFIYHIDYGKHKATCEIVSGFGGNYRINQIHGPRNQDNLACEWGKKVINGWISKFLIGAKK